MIEFMGALYNEEKNLDSLIQHVSSYVDQLNFVDDGSTDTTLNILSFLSFDYEGKLNYKTIPHTGLPETVKAEALKLCNPNSWVIMLDADERFAPGVLDEIKDFINSESAQEVTHIWFTLDEFIDNAYTGRTFQKCRLFKAWAAHFSTSVHVSDWFDGNGADYGWRVIHNKSSDKQKQREREYLETYKKLILDGRMTEAQAEHAKAMHYFIK